MNVELVVKKGHDQFYCLVAAKSSPGQVWDLFVTDRQLTCFVLEPDYHFYEVWLVP